MRPLAVLLPLLSACAWGPGIPQCMQALPRSEAEAAAITAEIRRELGDRVLIEQVEEWFFAATNDTPASFRACQGTIQRMVRHLYDGYFTKKPEKPIRVYLFRDKASYEDYCNRTYEKPPSTPFGFYMARERKMVMNIATGTGTLAHEIVHPLLSEDFPEVPSWFNEGFASLYEQSGPRNGRIVGLVNWRLPGLHKALRSARGVSLKELLETSTDAFYGDARGSNYAAARYLCLWLQERERLADFYRAFKASHNDDPTGRTALEKVVGKTLDDLEREWRDWVLTLALRD
ncbi:MAG TPA: hypothetical protein VEJ18_22305 [Planctomycetota bacterium]|nr:hypothetical protein [Planctomycetota bacterium]